MPKTKWIVYSFEYSVEHRGWSVAWKSEREGENGGIEIWKPMIETYLFSMPHINGLKIQIAKW